MVAVIHRRHRADGRISQLIPRTRRRLITGLGPILKKTALLKAILTRLQSELALSLHAARTAADGATDEQNKAENKYDTRGLELSYLAAGQGRKIVEAEATLEQLRSLVVRDFGPGERIDLGALVTLESGDKSAPIQSLYLLAPRGGGTEVRCGGREVVVITPQSPLGQQLMGRGAGECFPFGRAGGEQRIAGVC